MIMSLARCRSFQRACESNSGSLKAFPLNTELIILHRAWSDLPRVYKSLTEASWLFLYLIGFLHVQVAPLTGQIYSMGSAPAGNQPAQSRALTEAEEVRMAAEARLHSNQSSPSHARRTNVV